MSNSARVNKAFAARVHVLTKSLTYTDASAAATTKQVDIGDLPAGALILGAELNVSTLFDDPGPSTYTLAIGNAGVANDYAASLSLNAAARVGASTFKSVAAATTIKAQFTSSSANLSTLTQGAVDVNIYYALPNAD